MKGFSYEGKKWYVLQDAATLLDMKNVSSVKDSIPLTERVLINRSHPLMKRVIKDRPNANRIQFINLVTESGLAHLCSRSRKINSIKLAKKLGLKVDRKCPYREANTMNVLITAFSHLSPVAQYPVKPFFVDLYLPSLKLAIECDEPNSHRDRKRDDKRQKKIESMLGCRFIRYNPDSPNFNISVLIRKIMRYAYEGKLKPVQLSWLTIT